MSGPYQLDGLIAWSQRPEWQSAVGACFYRHIEPPCDAAGITAQELARLVDEHYVNNAWAAAFEDLLATDLPDGRNLADDYLRRRGWKEAASTREYITGLRRSVLSLYEVSDIVPGESMLLRDLIRGGEPVRVFEKSGTRGARMWDRIAVRVIPVGGKFVLSGMIMVFDQKTSDALLAAFRRALKKAPRELAAVARKMGKPMDAAQLAAIATTATMLPGAATLFTDFWLGRALEAAQGRARPTLLNSDGDPIQFVTMRFAFLPGVTASGVRQALAALPALRQENANFWNWLAEPGAKPKPLPGAAEARIWITTMDDGSLVLGTVEIKGRRLSFVVNSEARAERGRALLETVLAALVQPPLTERTDPDQLLAAKPSRKPLPPSGLSPEEERAALHQFLDEHYRRVLDEPIPTLGNRSPRACAKTPKGREKVVAWLKGLENHRARQNPDDPMASYDMDWMWQELGVATLKR